ncbi:MULTISPECIES: Crp/Fnr family transcriptional regulator [Ramlibacter]|nr:MULTISPECIES: Crp/Fnr family transcriptional regulator [Ramlibacter]
MAAAGVGTAMSGPGVQTASAAALVTSVAPRRPVEEQLRAAGLELLGCCVQLSDRRELLQESPLLADFTPAELDILGEAMLRVRAQAGQVLIAEDDISDWMMLLLSGTVDVGKRKVGAEVLQPPRADTTRLAVVKAGAVLGEMSMLDGEPRYASCWALGEVEAAVLSRAAVARLITEQPAVGAKLLVKLTQLLAQRLRNTSNQVMRMLQAG